MTRTSLYLVFSLLVLIAAVVLLVVRILDWQDERRAHGGYRMSRRQRRALRKERAALNPALEQRSGWSPTVWRLR